MKPVSKEDPTPTIDLLVPERFSYIFADRPVLWFEDEALYDSVLANYLAELSPEGILELQAVKEVTDEQWEAMRLRRIKKASIEAEMPDVIVSLLGYSFSTLGHTLGESGDKDDLKHYALISRRHTGFERDTVQEVMELTATSYDELLYRTFVSTTLTSSVLIERLERAERRRDELIKRYHERRATLRAMKNSLIEGQKAVDVAEVLVAEPGPAPTPRKRTEER